jgi:hypothetical protein
MQHLAYSNGLSASEQATARAKLATLPADLAQQLLDELAGRLEASTLLASSLTYLRALVSRACTGNFTPEAALSIAEQRKRQRQIEATLRQTESAHSDVHALIPAGRQPAAAPTGRDPAQVALWQR